MIPAGTELAYLIRCPKEWAELLEECEHAGMIKILQMALELLPESSVRDARLARVLKYQGRTKEAIALVAKHTSCPLCKAMYFALLVSEGDEDTMRQIVDTWRPDWKAGAELIEFEALYRSYVALASAATHIKRFTTAREMYQTALSAANYLGHNIKAVLCHEHGLLEFKQGSLYSAMTLFQKATECSKSGSAVHLSSTEYMLTIAHLTQMDPSNLPDWAELLLNAAQDHQPVDFEVPDYSDFARMVRAQASLVECLKTFYVHLPFMYQEKRQLPLKAEVENLLSITAEAKPQEVTGFLQVCYRALGKSLLGDTGAIADLQSAFKGVSTIPLMVMVYHAVMVQLFAHLPKAKERSAKEHLRVLAFQVPFLTIGERGWLQWWMRDFAPVPVCLLMDLLPEFRAAARKIVFVRGEQAEFEQDALPAYPVQYMNSHVLGMLAGEYPSIDQRMQWKRHRDVLSSRGLHRIVFQSVLDHVRS